MQEQVQEYFNNYFGGTLNESITDEEIMEAVYDLVYSTELVLNEIKKETDDNLLQRHWKKIHASRAREKQDDANPLTKKQSDEIIDKIKKQRQQEFDIGHHEESVNLDEKSSKKGKRVAQVKDMIKIKLAKGTEIGHEMHGVGPGGKKTLLKKGSTTVDEETEREKSIRMLEIMAKKKKDYPNQSARARKMLQRIKKTPAVIDGVIQGDRLDKKKFGTGNVYKPDTVQGKPVDEMYNTTLDSYIKKVDKQINKDGSTDTSVPNWKKRARGLSKAKHRKATGNWEFDEKDAQAKEKARRESEPVDEMKVAGQPIETHLSTLMKHALPKAPKAPRAASVINRTKLKNKLGAEVARVTHGDKKHTPKTNKQARILRKLEKIESVDPDTVQGKPVKDVSEKYTVKYAKHKRGKIQTASFESAEKAKEHLANIGQEGYKGIVSKDGKPLKVEEGTASSWYPKYKVHEEDELPVYTKDSKRVSVKTREDAQELNQSSRERAQSKQDKSNELKQNQGNRANDYRAQMRGTLMQGKINH